MAAEPTPASNELGEFLRARRTQITPSEARLTPGPGLRRTPGLRREEAATLAGVSNDYYTRLERGKETRPNPAYVLSRTGEVLAWNPGGLQLFPGADDWPVKQRNIARYLFLHPAARELFPTGTSRSAPASPGYPPSPAPTPTPPTSPAWSANSSSKAPTSPASGNATKSKATPTAPRPCTIPSSAPSPSAFKP